MHAGSIDEREDERGYAHFVEHMAFNGSRHYPPGQLIPFFQRHGMAWGADVNANTSFTYTIYKLELPAGHGDNLGEALQVLSDYADGVEFKPAEVRREKNVILSEIRARSTGEYQISVNRIAEEYGGTLLPARLPLGDPDLVKRATADSLRAFYQRCYRPERMELVIVGDVTPESLTTIIGQDFASPKSMGHGSAPVVAGPLHSPRLSARVISNPLVNGEACVALVAVAPLAAARLGSIENYVGAGVVIDILNRRLAARRAAVAPKFGIADASINAGIDDRYIHYVLEASTAQNDWAPAVDLIENELRRAREHGFDASEVNESVAVVLANLRSQVDIDAGATPDRLANNIAIKLAANRQWIDPAAELAIADQYLKQFTPEMASAKLSSILPDNQFHLELTLKQAPTAGERGLIAAYESSAAKPLAAVELQAIKDVHFQYSDFGLPGVVATRRSESDLGLELVKFANGVALNLRPSKLEPRRFHLAARIGRGVADVPRDKPGIFLLGMAYWSRCDLGRHTREEVERLFALHALVGNYAFNDDKLVVEISGPSEELPFALQVLSVTLSDLKMEASRMPQATSSYTQLTFQLLGSTSGLAKVGSMFQMTGEDPRYRIPPQSDIARYSFDEISSWLRTCILEGPLEIGIVGDINVDAAVTAAASSVGTLTPRRGRSIAASEQIHFLARPLRNLSLVDMPDQSAAVRLLWPVKDGADVHIYRALQVGAAALEERLRVTLRQELGVTYAPSCNVYRDNEQPGFGIVAVDLTFPPRKAQKLAQRSLKLADGFSRHGLSKEEFSRAIEPLRSAASADLRSNDWWLWNVLYLAQSRSEVLDEARSHGAAFDKITLDDVNRVVAMHFGIADSSVVGAIPRAAFGTK